MSTDNADPLPYGDIMVVEDDTSALRFMSELLTKAGYRVRAASSGELALRSVRAKLPDLILLDINLPGMNGVEVCRRLKADPETRDLPIIFISALGEIELKVKALEAGGTDYVTKPIEATEVLARIHTHLNMHRLQRRLAVRSEELMAEITERKQAEEALTLLSAQLDTKNKELERIIYVTSHDLRSPLVNIDGFGRELEQAINELRSVFNSDQTPAKAIETVAPLLAHEMPEALRFIRTSASKMDALLTGLVKLSRSGRSALTIDSLDMNELLAKVVDASEFQIKQAGAELDMGDLPPCKGDAVQVNQVFSNLLGNALQYLDPKRPGAIRISGRVEGKQSLYCVEDNGIGIAPAHQQNIFEIFHRLDPSKGEGEGLGLTIVQQILGRLSGEIRVESKPGEGSRFRVTLPAAAEVVPSHLCVRVTEPRSG